MPNGRNTAFYGSLALGLAIVALGPPAQAGPARYDKDTRSFRFSYTFATLPGAVGQGQATVGTLVGSVQKPSPEQEANVKVLVGKVSDVLFRATAGRAKISRLDYVDDIKDADIVVSLTGRPASAGWAIRGAINGQPGQIVFYYQSLVPEIQQDVVFTAAHEVCHYIFGLTDEYTPVYSPGCPARAGTPGCLMDNFLSGARGYMGRFCAGDHNEQGDQRQSCQAIVDKFFDDQGVRADANALSSVAGDPRPMLVEAAIGQVRAKRRADLAAGKLGTGLESFARTTLKALFAEFNRESPLKLPVADTLLADLLKTIVRQGSSVPIENPAGLEPKIFGQIKAEADRLTEFVSGEKAESTRSSKIRAGLSAFIKLLRSTDAISKADLAPSEETKLVKRLADDGARPAADRGVDRLVGLADITAALNQSIASDVVTILDSLGEPGVPARRDYLASVDRDLKKYAIPGRLSTGFGLRRTRLIIPDPINLENNIVLAQGGIFPYDALRNRSIVQFTRLIQRSKIELARPSPGVLSNSLYESLAGRLDNKFERLPDENPWSTRSDPVNLRALMQDTLDQLQRGRLENIIFLVPPGGLPASFGDQLQVLHAKLKSGLDVRIDVVIVGPTPIPEELRHLSAISRGTVLNITDIDEIGAISQRLKNEQSSGSWVTVPQQAKFSTVEVPPTGLIAHFLQKQEPSPPTSKFKRASAKINHADKEATKLLGAIRELKKKLEVLPASPRRGVLLDLKAAIDIAPAVTRTDAAGLRQLDLRANILEIEQRLTDLVKLVETAEVAGKPNEADLDPAFKTRFMDRGLEIKIGAAIARLKTLTALIAQQMDDQDLAGEMDSRNKLATTIAATKVAFGAIDDSGLPSELWKISANFEASWEAILDVVGVQVPIYRRVDRDNLDKLRLGIETKRFEVPATQPGSPLVRLNQFHAEEQGEFELIIGLSRELPKLRDPDRPGDARRPIRPKLTLRDPRQLAAIRVPSETNIKFDEEASTRTLLVYRSEKPFSIPPGWYTPVLEFDPETLQYLRDNEVNYTFTVGSSRSNIQLIASLVQPPGDGTRGTLRSKVADADGRIGPNTAVIEVQVSCGSSVLGAQIGSVLQRIDLGVAPIDPEPMDFLDDGKGRDRVKGDGVYTGTISLAGVTSPTEFRVFIQADTTDGKATYIPLDDPTDDGKQNAADHTTRDKAGAAAREAVQAVAEGAAERFQRATSIHFHVVP